MSDHGKQSLCRLCGYSGCEVNILGCGCPFHARCVPVSIFAQFRQAIECNTQPEANNIPCPSCGQKVTGFSIYPLELTDLEEAGRRNHDDCLSELGVNKKRKRGKGYSSSDESASSNSEENVHATASPFLLWSNSPAEGASQNDRLHFRTGRWSSSETEYVDKLIQCFDQSSLALPHGIKLNEFLRDVLMCKSSRLTKKMKNAKLSHRSYRFATANVLRDFKDLSMAQQGFLDSISSPVIRLVLKFNISRTWRVHFSNLCLQAGYDAVANQEWLDSLDELDRRVNAAEESVRQCRRNRLVKALRKDSLQESIDGVYFGSHPGVQPSPSKKQSVVPSIALASLTTHFTHQPEMDIPTLTVVSNSTKERKEPPSDFAITTIKVKPTPMSDMNTGNDNFSIDFLDLDDSVNGDTFFSLKDTRHSYKSKNVFLSRIMNFIEEQDMPFHCIDCWVPCNKPDEQSIGPGTDSNSLRLIHAGDDFHSDLTSLTEYHLHEFGVYSKNYSFAPGAGMPGRCYSTMSCCWESDIQKASADHFKRLGGARYAGIQTAVGIPMSCPNIGTIVIGIYSLMDVPYDENIMKKCSAEFQKFNPEPKWSLSIDVPNSETKSLMSTAQLPVTSTQSVHSCGSRSQSSYKSNTPSSCSTHESIDTDQAMSIANLLAEHMPPLDQEGNKADLIRSLRMLLLKSPNQVPPDILNKLVILRKSYEGYCKVQRKKSDVVKLLICDWEYLSKEEESQSPWGVSAMTHVNYSASKSLKIENVPVKVEASQVTPRVEDFPPTATNTSSFMLPPSSSTHFSQDGTSGSLNSYRFVSSVSLTGESAGGKEVRRTSSSLSSD